MYYLTCVKAVNFPVMRIEDRVKYFEKFLIVPFELFSHIIVTNDFLWDFLKKKQLWWPLCSSITSERFFLKKQLVSVERGNLLGRRYFSALFQISR